MTIRKRKQRRIPETQVRLQMIADELRLLRDKVEAIDAAVAKIHSWLGAGR